MRLLGSLVVLDRPGFYVHMGKCTQYWCLGIAEGLEDTILTNVRVYVKQDNSDGWWTEKFLKLDETCNDILSKL
jgi:hypothetical protein